MSTEKRLIDATPIIDECKECSAQNQMISVPTEKGKQMKLINPERLIEDKGFFIMPCLWQSAMEGVPGV